MSSRLDFLLLLSGDTPLSPGMALYCCLTLLPIPAYNPAVALCFLSKYVCLSFQMPSCSGLWLFPHFYSIANPDSTKCCRGWHRKGAGLSAKILILHLTQGRE